MSLQNQTPSKRKKLSRAHKFLIGFTMFIVLASVIEPEDNISKNEQPYVQLGLKALSGDKQALEMLHQGANNNNPSSQFRLGLLASRHNPQKAFQWYQKAAEQGHANANYNLAQSYEKGIGTSLNLHKAFQSYLKASYYGYQLADLQIARFFAEGLAVDKDEQMAHTLFVKAEIKGGIAEYWYNTGYLYEKSIQGQKQNISKAISYYKKSAHKGFPEAQYKLSLFLSKGKGISKDLLSAYKWLKLSQENGYKHSQLTALISQYETMFSSQQKEEINQWVLANKNL